MEDQHSEYRKAMVDMRRFLPKRAEPIMCFTCVGFKTFGGLETEDMTKGPMCVCDETWKSVQAHVHKMKTKKLLTI